MPTKRVLRVNNLIKQELNRFFLRELDFYLDTLVTITRVDTYSNLIESKVYISVWPESRKADIGIVGAPGNHLLYKDGKIVRRINDDEIYEILLMVFLNLFFMMLVIPMILEMRL